MQPVFDQDLALQDFPPLLPATCQGMYLSTHRSQGSEKGLMSSFLANNQATRRNEITNSHLQLGSSSNRYASSLPQQEIKSSFL
jgi:hypothetical protein